MDDSGQTACGSPSPNKSRTCYLCLGWSFSSMEGEEGLPSGTVHWGEEAPLSPSPLSRPIQAAIRTDSLDVQGLGSREDLLSEVKGPAPPPLARASSFWGRPSPQAPPHSRSQSKISKHMPPAAPCPGLEPARDEGPPDTRSSLELDTELS